jgi:hypothetical protein
LQLWSQVLGKTRLALAPMVNHWWQVPLYVTARGLAVPLLSSGEGGFDIELDLEGQRLEIRTTEGGRAGFALEAGGASVFYRRFFEALHRLKLDVAIRPGACEIVETIRLDQDDETRPYVAEWTRRFHRALVSTQAVFQRFRGRFVGKASPVHFFWGSFDLAVTRFSGKRAPPHPGGVPHLSDAVMREAYSDELSSAGFWPGDSARPEALFYSYAYPEPAGFKAEPVAPAQGHYDQGLREFVLPYAQLRETSDPAAALNAFLETTYAAAARRGHWPRHELERTEEEPMKYACEELTAAAVRKHGVLPRAHGCEECLRAGEEWVHLRLCLTCGHVGCCDSSPGRHATQHSHRTQHPVIRSYEPEEEWGYCYRHDATAEQLPHFEEESTPVHFAPPQEPSYT